MFFPYTLTSFGEFLNINKWRFSDKLFAQLISFHDIFLVISVKDSFSLICPSLTTYVGVITRVQYTNVNLHISNSTDMPLSSDKSHLPCATRGQTGWSMSQMTFSCLNNVAYCSFADSSALRSIDPLLCAWGEEMRYHTHRGIPALPCRTNLPLGTILITVHVYRYAAC